ncbi:hypothetical protein A2949_00045 [Candidatus Adlerbacteria bacterium RIFCSPLOWO2_01_FULL_54_21b]|uniref:Uncharacterized protein n=1 Tax=Candidatus Adlerbacteria bacterium RIFCSPLOWO2_01_FULL_54_21b TaxID=1797245 RepID=A0A1F4XYN8_9BACT|nr:MAG: hypothetical protein A2949_00045 [Candidatus Adlerbacteria bacterium RIFCSPLOWO2_01_FULL_54_21b]
MKVPNIFLLYLLLLLKRGQTNRVFDLIDRWRYDYRQHSLFADAKFDAADKASDLLISQHGYQQCPYCDWAIVDLDQHFDAKPRSDCWYLHTTGDYPNYN